MSRRRIQTQLLLRRRAFQPCSPTLSLRVSKADTFRQHLMAKHGRADASCQKAGGRAATGGHRAGIGRTPLEGALQVLGLHRCPVTCEVRGRSSAEVGGCWSPAPERPWMAAGASDSEQQRVRPSGLGALHCTRRCQSPHGVGVWAGISADGDFCFGLIFFFTELLFLK